MPSKYFGERHSWPPNSLSVSSRIPLASVLALLSHGRTITCEVTSQRKGGKGLEIPCVYGFVGISFSSRVTFSFPDEATSQC